METVYRCCCGIDVHKKLIVACLKKGGRQELREFGTMTGVQSVRADGCKSHRGKCSSHEGRASESITTPLQRALLRQILNHIDDLNQRVAVLDEMVEEYMAEYAQSLDAIDELSGVARQSAPHLCSWAGVCPGNRRSAGKRKNGRTNSWAWMLI